MNNAVARVAGLLAVAVVGAVCAAQFSSAIDAKLPVAQLGPQVQHAVSQAKQRTLVADASAAPPAARPRVHAALESASEKAFRVGIAIGGLLAILGGVISFVGLEPLRRPDVKAEACPGGAICGAGEDVRLPQLDPQRQLEPPPAAARAG